VAKDFASQLNISAMDCAAVNIHQDFHITGLEANAVQNSVSNFLGPQLPSSQILSDQLMVLEQVKNNPAAKSGDRGIIETITSKAVKLQFVTEETKRAVLDIEANPLHYVFQVNVEVRSVGGKPALCRIIEVVEAIPREDN
jgi:hypothetical protein